MPLSMAKAWGRSTDPAGQSSCFQPQGVKKLPALFMSENSLIFSPMDFA
jgi:hypothetical protein